MLCGYDRAVELRHLRYFVAVAAELNFTRAALHLRVAQPALSRQIAQLEGELGVRLLVRSRRGVALTDAGRGFLEEARKVIWQSENAVRMAREGSGSSRGELRIGYVWGLFHSTAPAALLEFRRTHPGIATHLLDLSATEQAKGLVNGKIDAGFIGFFDEARDAGLAAQCVGLGRLMVALPETHRCARVASIPLTRLREELFIGISEETYPGASRMMVDACARAGFQPRVLQAAERGHAILGLVAAGCGIAVLPESLDALPHPGVVLRRLSGVPAYELFVAWNLKRVSEALQLFLDSVFKRAPRPASAKAGTA
jgi:DNA-binding transcriptional LysR family regulator